MQATKARKLEPGAAPDSPAAGAPRLVKHSGHPPPFTPGGTAPATGLLPERLHRFPGGPPTPTDEGGGGKFGVYGDAARSLNEQGAGINVKELTAKYDARRTERPRPP